MHDDTTTPGHFSLESTPSDGKSTSSRGETRVRAIVWRVPSTDSTAPGPPVTSSASLMSCARALFSGRIPPPSAPMLPGLGGDFDADYGRLDMLSSPSDSGPVALALTTSATGCSCSPRFPTPTASDYRGSTGPGSRRRTLAEWAAIEAGSAGETIRPHPDFLEWLMGLPIGWSESPP